ISDRVSFGRDPGCTVFIPVKSVSRRHAQIVRVQDEYYIEDLQSGNGTFVNNIQVTGRTLLRHNDQVRICDFLATFLVTLEESGLAERLCDALAGAPEEGDRARVEVLVSSGGSSEAECRRLREMLEINHVFYDRAELSGLPELLQTATSARTILGQ